MIAHHTYFLQATIRKIFKRSLLLKSYFLSHLFGISLKGIHVSTEVKWGSESEILWTFSSPWRHVPFVAFPPPLFHAAVFAQTEKLLYNCIFIAAATSPEVPALRLWRRMDIWISGCRWWYTNSTIQTACCIGPALLWKCWKAAASVQVCQRWVQVSRPHTGWVQPTQVLLWGTGVELERQGEGGGGSPDLALMLDPNPTPCRCGLLRQAPAKQA